MPVGIAIGVGSAASGFLGARGSRKAAQAQERGNLSAIEEQRRQFDIILGLTQPGRDVGNEALNTLAGIFGIGGEGVDANTLSDTLRNVPGSQFLINEAERGVGASFAARGGAFGGNAIRALGERTAGIADNLVINRLLQLAGFGPQATGQAVAGTSGTSNNIASLLSGIGAARAGGFAGSAGSVSNAFQGGLSNFLLAQGLGLFGGGGGGGSGGGSPFATGTGTRSFSDRRLKTNIKRIGTVNTYPWYSFDYVWGEHSEGVMADEIPAEFVSYVQNYAMVDYGRLLGTV